MMLLECIDVCQTLGMRDESWRVLEDLLTTSVLSETHIEEVSQLEHYSIYFFFTKRKSSSPK